MILDCTFRDGGYYTGWMFSTRLFSAYLKAMDAAGVDYAEVGFRSPRPRELLRAHESTTDAYLLSFGQPKRTQLAVMINAKEYLGDPELAVLRTFSDRRDSPLSMVRIAATAAEAIRCEKLCIVLSRLGYMVALNLMQCGGPHAMDVVKEVNNWGSVDVLYIADSLGSLTTDRVPDIFCDLVGLWHGEMGIHAHNNMGYALANTLAAKQFGVEWLDGTVLGMGRGAGNTPTEQLLVALDENGVITASGAYDQLVALVAYDFSELQKLYRWGPSVLYFLSAMQGTHPSYVQEMMSRGHLSRKALSSLIGASSYDASKLDLALKEYP